MKSSATLDTLFKVDPESEKKLYAQMAQIFYYLVASRTLHTTKRACPDTSRAALLLHSSPPEGGNQTKASGRSCLVSCGTYEGQIFTTNLECRRQRHCQVVCG
jgi:hypothetical protein